MTKEKTTVSDRLTRSLLIDEREFESMLGLRPGAGKQLRHYDRLPEGITAKKIGRLVRYVRAEVEAFIEGKQQVS